jgi:CarD family transcriptional regulator
MSRVAGRPRSNEGRLSRLELSPPRSGTPLWACFARRRTSVGIRPQGRAAFGATATLSGVELGIGDVVVYPAYGVGRIARREERLVLGVKTEILVLELAEGLSVTLPVDHADRVLRPVLSEADIVRVQKTLREKQALSEDGWLKRKRDVQAKVVGGDPEEMAEIVRNGARRERGLQEKKAGSQLSPSERDLYRRARWLLSSEIGSARGLDLDAADAWIEEQLVAPS